jgi:FixJ family two-component response regulator
LISAAITLFLDLQSKLNDMHCILPLLFITGHGDVPMAVQAIKDGAMNFIQKPFRDQQLLDYINDALKPGIRISRAIQPGWFSS